MDPRETRLLAWLLAGTSLFLAGCPLPVGPKPPPVVAAIAAGGAHTCATLSDGRVKCWGLNTDGQLGNASNTDSYVPVEVIGATATPRAGGVTAGGGHTCVTAGGTVACTGLNHKGQLGNGTMTDSNVLQPAQRIVSAGAVAAGAFHTCALQGAAVGCWGAYSVQGIPYSLVPKVVPGVAATAVAARGHHTCVIEAARTVKCWTGSNYIPLTPGQGIPAIVIAVGRAHACAIEPWGTVKCWGSNTFGQLGDGSMTSSSGPVEIRHPGNLRAIALGAGSDHTCAVFETGSVECWGSNNYGQLGNGSNQESRVPVPVAGLSHVTAVALGDNHSCALTDDGRVACWGWNHNGQLGNGSSNSSSTPVVIISGLP